MTSLYDKPALNLSRIAIHAVLLLAVLLYLVPLVVMLLTSFKSPEDIGTGNLLSWPTEFTAIGWSKAWATVSGYFVNSVLITVPAVLISTAIGALNGYVLSMWRFRGSQLFFGLLLFGCFCRSRPCCCRPRSPSASWAWPAPTPAWCWYTWCTGWPSPRCFSATTT